MQPAAFCRPLAAWNSRLDAITPPTASRCSVPYYPDSLRRAHIEGHAFVRVWIGPGGVPKPFSITFPEVSAPEFAQAIRNSIPHIRFVGTGEWILVELRHEFALASQPLAP